MTRYNIVNGEEIRSYEEVEYNGTRIVTVYDSSGKNAYRQATYVVNENTQSYVLQYVDQWMMNEKGEVIKDYKQYVDPVGSIEMNPEYVQGKDHHNNYFRKSGCLLTSMAEVFDYYGETKFDTQEKIDAFVDENKLWLNGTAEVNAEAVVKKLKKFEFEREINKSAIDTKIQENLLNNTPTILHYERGHFAVVVGARYNAKGEITEYLINDPGTSMSAGKYIPVNTLYNYHWKSRVDKLYWVMKR